MIDRSFYCASLPWQHVRPPALQPNRTNASIASGVFKGLLEGSGVTEEEAL